MGRLALVSALLLMPMVSVVGSALAEDVPCGNKTDVAKLLDDRYGETPISNGLQGNGELMQVYASPETGTWTMVTTTAQGVSCVVATGQRWSDGDSSAPQGSPEDRVARNMSRPILPGR